MINLKRSNFQEINYVSGKLEVILKGGNFTSNFIIEVLLPKIKYLASVRQYYNDSEYMAYVGMLDLKRKFDSMLLEKNNLKGRV